MKQFIQEVEKGLKSPVYFLYSEESYLLREASVLASMTIPEGERSFGLSVFDLGGIDEKPSFEQVADVLNTIPFMRGRKIVVIENIQEFAKKKEMEQLEAYVANPSPFSVLILLHRGNLKAHFKEFLRKVKAVSLDMRQQDFPLWIREKARQKGFTLSNGAVEYLLGVVGPDVGLISADLEKFVLIGKDHVDREDIMGIVSGFSDYSVFDLVDAIKQRDAARVFRIARALQDTADSYGLLGAINWHFSRISSRDKDHSAYYDKIFGLLNEADLGIKTSGGTYPMEYLLIRLLQA
ncbi:MAG TPA: DNA polymerase III subunit delta [Thermodesulfovibrionales bacterium]|nr:DNA polymerase III subunit delta [Thermodesulfovibrionales bacterium]